MEGPSQAGALKREEGLREEEDVEQQQRHIQEHPAGEYAHQATKGEISVEKLNIIRDSVMSTVISNLDGKLNPRPAYNNGVYFDHSRFCEDCLDKVTTAITDGLRKERKDDDKQHKNIKDAPVPIKGEEEEDIKEEEEEEDAITNVSSCPSEEEEDVITLNNARLVATTFMNGLSFRVNDHVSFEFFNREGMKECLDRDSFGGLPYEVARVVDHYGHDKKYAICEKLLGQHAHAATRSTGIVYDENDQDPITKLSDHSGLTIGEVLSSAIGDKRCSCMQSESFKDNEREDAEELAHLAKGTFVLYSDSEEEEGEDSDSDSEEEEEPAADGVKCRIVNYDFRPSRSVKAESERGDAPPLCLSICRHFDGNNCPFNTENKRKIFNAIKFVKQEREGKEGDGGVVEFIDGERYKIELYTTNIPSFSIGSSVYEVLAYDHDPLTLSEWEDEERETKMSDVGTVLCDQIFAKPCAKAYLTVTTASVPWPCIVKTPPMSDVNSEGKYGSFRSFVVPLPCSYGGRRLNDPTNVWRSRIYSNFVEDFVKRSVRPAPKGRLLDLSARTWDFSTRNATHHQLKVFGSVLRSECGDLDPSPLEYETSTSLCSRDAVAAQSDFSKLRGLLDTCNKVLNTFTDGPYRESTVRMKKIASDIEQEMEKNTEEEETARNVMLETLKGQFEEERRRVVFMSELATKQNNFSLQLNRQLNYLSHLFASYVPGF